MEQHLFEKNIKILSTMSVDDNLDMACNDRQLPSVQAMQTIMELVRNIVFPA